MKRLYFAGEVLDIDGPTGGLISRQRSLRDTLLEILLIKMTFAFSLNIWYFSVLREEHRGLQRNLGFSNFLEGWLTLGAAYEENESRAPRVPLLRITPAFFKREVRFNYI